MSDDVNKQTQVDVQPAVPDKVIVVIDPVSVPLKFAEDVGKVVVSAGNAIANSAKKTGKKIAGWFK